MFESALGQHNLITLLKKTMSKNEEHTEIVNVKTKGFAGNKKLNEILYKNSSLADYVRVNKEKLYDGSESYMRILEGENSVVSSVLAKISEGKLIDNMCFVNQGIVSGADKLSNRHIEKFKIDGVKGEGIFVLHTDEIQKKNLSELERKVMKPFFKNSDISRYFSNIITDKSIIYINRELKSISGDYPNIENHLYKYYDILSQRREVKKGSIEYFHLQWGRNESIFQCEKIIAPQRSNINTFAYNNIPWYSSADVYYITPRISKVKLKYLLGILNSKLYYVWFYYRGKRKGKALELYQTPLKETPVIYLDEYMSKMIGLVDEILKLKNNTIEFLKIQNIIDNLVYEIYNLNNDEVAKVEEIFMNR